MPWQYATPVTDVRSYDALRVESFEVRDVNSPNPRLWVTCTRGSLDPVTGVFSIGEEAQTVEIAAATVLAIMASVPAGVSLYSAIKAGIYEALHTDGLTPPGSLE